MIREPTCRGRRFRNGKSAIYIYCSKREEDDPETLTHSPLPFSEMDKLSLPIFPAAGIAPIRVCDFVYGPLALCSYR